VKSLKRIAVALIVVMIVSSLLGNKVPHLQEDLSNLEDYSFWLAVENAITYFFAAGLGAIVARKSFVIPALALAVVIWALTIDILFRIAAPTGPVTRLEIASENWLGFFLLVVAAISGAMFGRWFYTHEFEQTSNEV
jgi:hypothetical protein